MPKAYHAIFHKNSLWYLKQTIWSALLSHCYSIVLECLGKIVRGAVNFVDMLFICSRPINLYNTHDIAIVWGGGGHIC